MKGETVNLTCISGRYQIGIWQDQNKTKKLGE